MLKINHNNKQGALIVFKTGNATLLGTKSERSESESPLIKKLNDYLNIKLTSTEEFEVINKFIRQIDCCYQYSDINFETSVEDNESVISRKTIRGISIAVIDNYGDIMISFSPYKGKGWRKFYQYENYDYETVAYEFLS